jgi:hypothetical protein
MFETHYQIKKLPLNIKKNIRHIDNCELEVHYHLINY